MKEKDIMHKLVDEGFEAIGMGLKIEGKLMKPVFKEVEKVVWWYVSRNGLKPFLNAKDNIFLKGKINFFKKTKVIFR